MIKIDEIGHVDGKGSVVKNCYVWPREEDILFYFGKETRVNFDGYAIIPVEEFEKLEAIKNASKWLDKVIK